jgi:hypothetical protein
LHDARTRNDRLARFEHRLRQVLRELERASKPMLLSETGFPSAIGYHVQDDRLVIPKSDGARYGEVMHAFVDRIRKMNADYGERIRALYFYGGKPKFDIRTLI